MEHEEQYEVGRYYVMPRHPELGGHDFQSSVFQCLDHAHLMICETYTTAGAEMIAAALNAQQAAQDAAAAERARLRAAVEDALIAAMHATDTDGAPLSVAELVGRTFAPLQEEVTP